MLCGLRAARSSDSMHVLQYSGHEQARLESLVSIPILNSAPAAVPLDSAAQSVLSESPAGAVPSHNDAPMWPMGYLIAGWSSPDFPTPRCVLRIKKNK